MILTKILLVEDDTELADQVMARLVQRGCHVDHTADGRRGAVLARDKSYDVLVLDRMLPGTDGLSIVKQIRGAGIETPALYLTTMDSIEDRVAGLEAGGDDYLVKPFAFEEFLARVKALARRHANTQGEPTRLRVADLEMDLIRRSVSRAGSDIDLLPQEFKLLEYLMRHEGEIVTRTMLLEKVWNVHFTVNTSVVESHMSRLRAKIARAGSGDMIHTIRGAGYMLRAPS